MRGAVEAAICEHYQDNYNIPDGDMCRLPMICILVEGGPNSISTCVATIRNGNFLTLLNQGPSSLVPPAWSLVPGNLCLPGT